MVELKNKKAYFNYHIQSEIEAGIVLVGTEIKSIRSSSVDISDAFARIKNNEIEIINMYIAKYEAGNRFNHDERRTKKLLLHKSEIKKLAKEVDKEGCTLVPLKLYFKKNKVKILLGVGKGKKHFDKREAIKKRDIERDLKGHN